MKTEEQKYINAKRIILVLLVLLLLSGGALFGRIKYLSEVGERLFTVIVPDNLIGDDDKEKYPSVESFPSVDMKEISIDTISSSESDRVKENAAEISLYMGNDTDNEKFEVHNMFPGDNITKYFAVKVSHKADIELYFDTVVTDSTKNLGDILNIRVTYMGDDSIIYDGAFSDVIDEGYVVVLPTDKKTDSIAYYKIDVSLPTSAGNEYQAAGLMADLIWYVKDVEDLAPPTGDNMNGIIIPAAVLCLCGVGAFMIFRKRKGEDDEK